MNNTRSRYIPALDGIRTLAVAAVLLYHVRPALVPGGMQGVTVFFVLSGYLITHLLLNEYDRTQHIDFKAFWLRRLRRLVPATLAVVAVTAALCTLFNHVMLTKMRSDIVPSLLYLNNWWQIFNQVSYFNNVGDPSPLTHFWSLAIEAQFYLVWPVLLLIALKIGQPKHRIRRGVLILAAISALEMAWLYNPAADPSRVYYGTDTRAFSLLLGAWLAFVPAKSLEQALRSIKARAKASFTRGQTQAGVPETTTPHYLNLTSKTAVLNELGIAGLVGTLLLMAFSNGYSAFHYRGGTLLTSVCAVMLVASCLSSTSIISKLFSLKPLVWLGKRSYSIYLWHYPLLLLMNPASDVRVKPWWIYLLQIALVVAVSALCYRFIETPFRRGVLGKFLANVRAGSDTPQACAKRHAPLLAMCAVVAAVGAYGVVFVPSTSALSEEGAAALQDNAPTSSNATNNKGDKKGTDGELQLNASGFPEGSYDITWVGDSVSIRVAEPFARLFPHGHIDALKSRQFTAGMEVYRELLNQNLCGRVAVFALGTNGPISDSLIDELMDMVGQKRIAVFVNNRCPSAAWIDQNNEIFKKAAKRYNNVRIIDWYNYSANRNDLFDGDGTHVTAAGAEEYAQMVYEGVKNFLPVHLEDGNDPRILKVQAVLDATKQIFVLDLPSITVESETK